MNELIILDKLTDLEKVKAEQITKAFAPIVKRMNELGKTFPDISTLEMSPEKSALAKRFRLDIGKELTAADNERKSLKEESLKESKSIQSVYNKLKEGVDKIKEEARDIELYYERIEQEKKDKLKEERTLELEKYNAPTEFIDLANMPEDVWINYLSGVKNTFEENIKAEKKAERDRIKAEKEESAAREAMRVENEKLKIEADKSDKKRIADQKRVEKEKEARKQLERDIAEKETERLRLEKEKSDKLKAEHKKAKNAPDKEKLDKLISYMEEIGKGLEGDEAKDIVREAYRLIKRFNESL